jgi:serine/threonine protein kinase
MGRSQKELFRKIVAGKYEFDGEEWDEISDGAKDLVKQLLILDPAKRITATDAVRHEWLQASRDRLGNIMLQRTSQRLKTFNARMKLRSAMIAIDWVSSLRRMTSFSQRNLNASDIAASGQQPLIATARKMQEEKLKELEKREHASAEAKKAKSLSKKIKKMSLKQDEDDEDITEGTMREI